MSYLEIFLIISGIAIILLLIFCIPILIQIWRTTRAVAVTLESLNRDLPLILKNLEEITTNINNSTTAVDREIQHFSATCGRMLTITNDIFNSIQYVAPMVIKSHAFQTIKKVIAVSRGIRVFLNVLLAGPTKKV
jgi:uncharacterized protein YoxC